MGDREGRWSRVGPRDCERRILNRRRRWRSHRRGGAGERAVGVIGGLRNPLVTGSTCRSCAPVVLFSKTASEEPLTAEERTSEWVRSGSHGGAWPGEGIAVMYTGGF